MNIHAVMSAGRDYVYRVIWKIGRYQAVEQSVNDIREDFNAQTFRLFVGSGLHLRVLVMILDFERAVLAFV